MRNDIPDFESFLPDDASEDDRRRARAVVAHLRQADERISISLDHGELDALSTGLLTVIDYIESRLTGVESEYLRERWNVDGEDADVARQLVLDDLDSLRGLERRICKALDGHPATVERRAHLRGEREA